MRARVYACAHASVYVCRRVHVCVCLCSQITQRPSQFLKPRPPRPAPSPQLSELCDFRPILLMRTLSLRGLRDSPEAPKLRTSPAGTCVHKAPSKAQKSLLGGAGGWGGRTAFCSPSCLLPPLPSFLAGLCPLTSPTLPSGARPCPPFKPSSGYCTTPAPPPPAPAPRRSSHLRVCAPGRAPLSPQKLKDEVQVLSPWAPCAHGPGESVTLPSPPCHHRAPGYLPALRCPPLWHR